jgi:hypothetical protein
VLEKLEENNNKGRAEQLRQGGIYVVLETVAKGCITKH